MKHFFVLTLISFSTLSFSQVDNSKGHPMPVIEPLYVIDGKIMPALVKSKTDPTKMVSPINLIAPNEISEAQVLKGMEATAAYGEAGKNGALVITTKKFKAQWRESLDPKATEIWELKPKKITAGINVGDAPSDAIVLFDGKDLAQWSSPSGGEAKWTVKDGAMTVVQDAGDIITKMTFNDIQLHLEWRSPAVVTGEGQHRGNSGIFLQEFYELQVLDSYENTTFSNGLAGSLYKQAIPLVNVCRKPGEWQTYDVVYSAPRFSGNSVIVPACVTVFQNGVLIQNHVQLAGSTQDKGLPFYQPHGKGSIKLQDHGCAVSYRNIWAREL